MLVFKQLFTFLRRAVTFSLYNSLTLSHSHTCL